MPSRPCSRPSRSRRPASPSSCAPTTRPGCCRPSARAASGSGSGSSARATSRRSSPTTAWPTRRRPPGSAGSRPGGPARPSPTRGPRRPSSSGASSTRVLLDLTRRRARPAGSSRCARPSRRRWRWRPRSTPAWPPPRRRAIATGARPATAGQARVDGGGSRPGRDGRAGRRRRGRAGGRALEPAEPEAEAVAGTKIPAADRRRARRDPRSAVGRRRARPRPRRVRRRCARSATPDLLEELTAARRRSLPGRRRGVPRPGRREPRAAREQRRRRSSCSTSLVLAWPRRAAA